MRRRRVWCEGFVNDEEGEGVGVKERENGGYGHEDLGSPVQVGHDVVPVTKLWFLRLPVVLDVLGKGKNIY